LNELLDEVLSAKYLLTKKNFLSLDETKDHFEEKGNSVKVEDYSKKISKSHDNIEKISHKTVKSSHENEVNDIKTNLKSNFITTSKFLS